MQKVLVVWCILAALTFGCARNNASQTFDYERDAPGWLKGKVDSLSKRPDYASVRVYRYEWKGETLYDISLPLSSCMYCELYDANGNRYHIATGDLQAFVDADKHAMLVWKGPAL